MKALSTYLPSRDKLAVRLGDSMVHPNGSGAVPPVLMCHGKADTMVQYRHGKASAKRLHDLGVRTSYKGLQHSVNEAALEDAGRFLRKHLLPPVAHKERGEL